MENERSPKHEGRSMSTLRVTNIGDIAGGTASNAADGVIKSWVNYEQGTPAIDDSYNMSSVTDVSNGKWEPNTAVDFAASTFAIQCPSMAVSTSTRGGYHVGYDRGVGTKTVNSFSGAALAASSSGSDATLNDYDEISVFLMGDLA